MSLQSRILARARAKSMLDLHPEMQERVHIAQLRSDAPLTWSPYSYLLAIADHEQSTWVRKAVKVIQDAVAPLPLGVQRGDEAEPEHALAKLLNDVNDDMSSADLWRWWAGDMLLGGESGLGLVRGQASRAYVEFWPRQPHTVQVVPQPAGKRYWQVEKYVIDDLTGGQPYDLPPDEFIHVKFTNPRNPWRGLAPLSSVRQSVLIDAFAQAWSKMFFTKSARPDFAVIAPAGLTKDEKDDIAAKLRLEHGGLSGAHEPVVVGAGG